MAKTFSKSISLLTTLTLAAPVFASAAPSLLRAKDAAVSQSGLYGLE